MPRLKVFRAHQGFYDSIVAATSQAKALQAWGAKPSLFAQGFAEETKYPVALKAALAQPGAVLRRPFGSRGDFKSEPDLPAAPRLTRKQKQAHARAIKKREAEAARKARAARAAEQRKERAAKKELEEIEREEARLRDRRRKLRQKFKLRSV
ncbi:MAG TPA: hypothetical protein VLT91_00415 [Rhizomicrobium sp.]|nr:hypothetical protein [Rhizomicrobium sp.]